MSGSDGTSGSGDAVGGVRRGAADADQASTVRDAPSAQLPLELGDPGGLLGGRGVPARFAPELADLAALVERPVPDPSALSPQTRGGDAGAGAADDSAGPTDGQQLARFEDLHGRMRQVLDALDAG